MKKYLSTLFAICMLFGLTACGSDEPKPKDKDQDKDNNDNVEIVQKSIVGKWQSLHKLTPNSQSTNYMTINILEGGYIDCEYFNDTYPTDKWSGRGTWVYSPKDGTWEMLTGHSYFSGTYILQGENLYATAYGITYTRVGNNPANDDDNAENDGNYDDDDGSYDGGHSSHQLPCKSCQESGDCWNCFGSGIDPITNKKCFTCHGSGKCQVCHGKGYITV